MPRPAELLRAPPWAALALLVVGAAGPAWGAPGDAPEPEVRDAADCKAVFGDEAIHARNRERRSRRLLWIDERPGEVIEVAHSSQWIRPRPMEVADLSLVAANDGELVVQLGEGHSCPPGRYQLSVDDAVGRGNRVLAARDGIALLEVDDQLAYLTEDGATPTWQLIWASRFKFTPRRTNAVQVVRSKARSRRGRKARKSRSRRR